jgi:hypothetical protein
MQFTKHSADKLKMRKAVPAEWQRSAAIHLAGPLFGRIIRKDLPIRRLRAFPAEQHQISHIDDSTKGLPDYENRVTPPDGIAQQDNSARKTEIPEGNRDMASLLRFGSNPLDEKTGSEAELPTQTDPQPDFFPQLHVVEKPQVHDSSFSWNRR